MMQQHKLKSLLLCLTKTGRTPQNLTSTSPHSPFSLSVLESLTIMPCQNDSFTGLTYKLQYNSLSQGQSKVPPPWRNSTPRPPRSKEATATWHHSGEDPKHPMEEVAVTMTPMLWMWIISHYPQLMWELYTTYS